MSLTRRQFLHSTAAGLGAATAAPGAQSSRPNILFILTDDQRFDDLSCAGNPVLRTPNLDMLARTGVRFLNSFVTTSICCCSRATALTGQYMRRHGIEDFATPLTAAQFANTYPALLRKAGYRTAFLGKFAVGADNAEKRNVSLPADQFDYWYGFPQSINFQQMVEGEKRHLTPLMTTKAIDFLKSTPADRPFLMTLCYKEPHGPWNYFDPDRPNAYKDAKIPAPTTHTRADFEAQPEFLRASLNGHKSGKWPDDEDQQLLERTRTCYHLVAGIDESVGHVMAALRELKRDGNTVVIFASDNGVLRGAHGFEGKWIMYEESIRVPLIIRDPRLPKKFQGVTRDQTVLNIDYAPTMLRYAGLPVPSGMQGLDLAPLLTNPNARTRDEWYYEHTYTPGPGSPQLPIAKTEGVRTTRWKYTRYTQDSYEQLFDLKADPIERNNLASKPAHAKTLASMRERCTALRKQAG